MSKKQLMDVKTIIFDYDGTLHDSTHNYITAFKRAYKFLVDHQKATPREWQDEEITKWLGYSSKDMWENFMPDLEPQYQQAASKIIGSTLLEKVQANEAYLYNGALETMAYLKSKGYRMVFLSNCRREYMEAHQGAFMLHHYFEGMYCTEDYDFRPKYDIFASFQGNYEPKFLIIGDRIHDLEIGQHHEAYTIGCNYGFGTEEEMQMADIRINDIRDLQRLL